MSKIDALRKLIREEMRSVLKEELPKLISEGKKIEKYSETFKNKKESGIPLTLNDNTVKVNAPKIRGNDMLSNILNETAMGMIHGDEINFSSHDVDGFSLMQRSFEENVSVGSVEDMLNSSKASGVHEMVQINQVPDFSKLMDKMINNGTI